MRCALRMWIIAGIGLLEVRAIVPPLLNLNRSGTLVMGKNWPVPRGQLVTSTTMTTMMTTTTTTEEAASTITELPKETRTTTKRRKPTAIRRRPIRRKPTPTRHSLLPAPIGPIARGAGKYNAGAALPCCRDRVGEASCAALRRTSAATFERRCLGDHDFHTIDCCAQCRAYIQNHQIGPDAARSLLKAPVVCRDKHSATWCRTFVTSGMGKFSCTDAEFAVRVCRASCGYCGDMVWARAQAAPLCQAAMSGGAGEIAVTAISTSTAFTLMPPLPPIRRNQRARRRPRKPITRRRQLAKVAVRGQ